MNRANEFEKYFRLYYTPIGMYVLRMCGDAAEAEDIVQEAFSAAWEKFADAPLPEHFRAYLYRSAHNIAISHMRLRPPGESGIALEDLEEAELTDEAIDTSERDARLWIAISGLPERCRKVFLLSKRDGLSNAEIAEEMGISVKTVENQITKANKSLRHILRPSMGKVFFLPFL